MDASTAWGRRLEADLRARGAHADRQGDVRLVIVGTAEGARWDAVVDMIRRLR